jgi:hypothetical protein
MYTSAEKKKVPLATVGKIFFGLSLKRRDDNLMMWHVSDLEF